MPTFLQLYRLLSAYKLIKPPKFGNCLVDDHVTASHLTMDDIETIFGSKSESAIKKLKDSLDSLVENDDWDEELAVVSMYSIPELMDIILYSASGYLILSLIHI